MKLLKANHHGARRDAGFSLICFLFLMVFGSHGYAQDVSQQIKRIQELRRDTQYGEARLLLESLYRTDRKNIVFYNQLRDILFQLQDWEAALELIQERKRLNPSDINPAIDEARVWYRMGEHKRALKGWNRILEKYPKQGAMVQRIASVMTGERLYEEAIVVYLSGRNRIGESDRFALNLAHLYSATLQYGKATGEFLRYLKTRPKQAAYIEGQILRFPKSEAAAEAVTEAFEQFQKEENTTAALSRLFWRYLTGSGRYEKAYEAVLTEEAMTEKSKRGFAFLAFAAEALRFGAADYAIRAYQEILEKYPGFPARDTVLLGLGNAYRADSEFGAAISAYDQLIQQHSKSPGAPEALFQKGKIFQQSLMDFGMGATVFREVLLRYPASTQAAASILNLGLCYALSGEFDLAERTYRQVLERPSTKGRTLEMSARFYLSELYFWQGEFGKASEELDSFTATVQDVNWLKNSLFNDGLKLRMFINRHKQNSPEALLLYASAERLKRQSQPDSATIILDSLLHDYSQSSLVPEALYFRFGLWESLSRPEDALADLDSLLSQFPDHILADQALFESAGLMIRTGNTEEAIPRLERILVDYPNSLYVEESRDLIRRFEKSGT